MAIAIVSGSFDPLHAGQLELLKQARRFGQVHVLLNDDPVVMDRKGYIGLQYRHRETMLYAQQHVWAVHVLRSTIENGLRLMAKKYPQHDMSFCTAETSVPFQDLLDQYKIVLRPELGLPKLNPVYAPKYLEK